MNWFLFALALILAAALIWLAVMYAIPLSNERVGFPVYPSNLFTITVELMPNIPKAFFRM